MVKKEKEGKFNSKYTLKLSKEQDYKIKIKATIINGPSDMISIDYLRNISIDGTSVIVQKISPEKNEQGNKHQFAIEGEWRLNKYSNSTPDGKRHYMTFKAMIDIVYKNSKEGKWIKKQFKVHELIQSKVYDSSHTPSLYDGLNLKNVHFKINPWISTSSDGCTIII